MTEVYEPREDSFLILKEVMKYADGEVLDMGTGSGILAIEASQAADHVIGVDINKDAIKHAKEKAEGIENIEFCYSNLFSH